METNTIDNRYSVPFNNGRAPGKSNGSPRNNEWAETVREITSRLAIYRKLKALGHSDESIFTIYQKSAKAN